LALETDFASWVALGTELDLILLSELTFYAGFVLFIGMEIISWISVVLTINESENPYKCLIFSSRLFLKLY
jgi:hypothetical protein